MRFKFTLISVLILACIGSALFASPSFSASKDKFGGEFWNKGKHFQITGDIIPLASDGIHDPTNETAMIGLQPPVDAMRDFPRDSVGLTDWAKALDAGIIEPRFDMFGNVESVEPLDLDITFTNTGAMPNVLFPHRQHTQWLDCSNCHPDIFEQKKGANKFKMADILGGGYCGVCHGKVAFDTTKNCMRCHSVAAKAKKKK